MGLPKVFVTRRIPEKGLQLLEKHAELEINEEDRVLEKEEIKAGVKGKDGLLCLLTDTIDKEVISAGDRLKIISNYAVGFNNIDVAEATKRKIMVTNTPGVLTETVADFTWSLILGIARRLVEADKFARQGKFRGWAPLLFLGSDVYKKTLGIIGLGRIGKAVVKRAKGFEMDVIYYDVNRDKEFEIETGAKFMPIEEVIKQADYLSIHVPLLPDTHHLIGKKELAMMKTTAYLINTSRGPVVDEQALVDALKSNQIAGAALDVFEKEPEIHEGLINLDNVILLPHIASATLETRSEMAVMAAENMIAGLSGKNPPNIVNREVLEK
jgi:glyoxylate reductase